MGLVAHYKLDGNAIDGVNGLNGVENSTTYGTGKLGQAMTGGSATIANDSKLQIVGELSIAFWVRINSHSVRETLIGKSYGGEFTINIETEPHLRFYSGTAGTNVPPYNSFNTTALNTGQWYHAVIRKDANGYREWWIDGEFNSSEGANSISVGSPSSFDLILRGGYLGNGEIDADLDDVRFYDHTLSVKEIKELSKAKILHFGFDQFVEPTENFIDMDDWNAQQGWNTFWVAQTKTIESTNLLRSGSYVIRSMIDDTVEGGPAYKDVPVPTLTGGVTFTVSAWVKSQGRRVRLWVVSDTDYYSSYNTNDMGWERIETQVQSDTTGSIRVHFRCEAGNVGDIIWVTAPQVEQKDHATPFTANIRRTEETIIRASRPDIRPYHSTGNPFEHYIEQGEYFNEHIRAYGGNSALNYEYVFTVPEEKNYDIDFYIQSPDGGTNSFYIQLDSDTQVTWHTGQNPAWHWATWSSPLLTAGEHTLRVAPREPTPLSAIRIGNYEGRRAASMLPDNSGQDHQATLRVKTSPTWVQDETFGGAYNFNGVDQLIEVDDDLDITEELSAFAWVRPSITIESRNIIAKRPANQGWIIHNAATNLLKVYVFVGGWHSATSASAVYSVGEWVHVGLTYDGETLQGYANGIEVCSSTAPSGPIISSVGIVEIGGTKLYNQMWPGDIADVRVYATALSAEDVSSLYRTSASIDDKGALWVN